MIFLASIQPALRPSGRLIFNSSFQCRGCLQRIAVFLHMWSLSPSALKWAPCPYSSVYFCLVGVTSFTAWRYAYTAFYFWKLLACDNYTQRSRGLANSTVLSCHKDKRGGSKSASKACQGSGTAVSIHQSTARGYVIAPVRQRRSWLDREAPAFFWPLQNLCPFRGRSLPG